MMKAQKPPPRISPSPCEIAQIAVTLFESHGGQYTPEYYFGPAYDLLLRAQQYLASRMKPEPKGGRTRFAARFLDDVQMMFNAGMTVAFSRLLRPVRTASGNKKGVSELGSLTTLNGLEKAVRRYFSPAAAKQIIQAQELTHDQFNQLMDARKAAVKRRAETRVKRASAEKTQGG